MPTDAPESITTLTAQPGDSERLSWGAVDFQVTDLDRTVAFWTTVLGLRVRDQRSETTTLGTRAKPLVVFHAGATEAVRPQYSGLYHVAIGVSDQAEFSRLLARLIAMRVPVSPVDHLMSKAIYLKDPDGLEIELTLETPERLGRLGDMSRGLLLYDTNGQPHNGRAQLDVAAELTHAAAANLKAPLADGAYVAHLHFKVPQLESAATWFEGVGFERNLMLPNWGFADMRAGTNFAHRLALNTWAGPDLPPAPPAMARLTHYALHVHDPAIMTTARGLQPAATGLTGRDPMGTKISLVSAQRF